MDTDPAALLVLLVLLVVPVARALLLTASVHYNKAILHSC
jgi:hypothetical protein